MGVLSVLILDETEDLYLHTKETFKRKGSVTQYWRAKTAADAIEIYENNANLLDIGVIDADIPGAIELIKMIQKDNEYFPLVIVGSQGEENFYNEISKDDEDLPLV